MISTLPYKGTRDFYPDDMLLQNYIFSIWRKVCLAHGFMEYQTPIIENCEIYEAKSGEDVGNKELYKFQDLGGRKICLRPEMTPSVTRIISSKYKELPKPIKVFSIGSFYRQERPQKGRMREFWQLNVDIFGENSIGSDIEIILIVLDILKQFRATKDMFKIQINHRKLILGVLEEIGITSNQTEIVRMMDKFQKLSNVEFKTQMMKWLNDEEKFHLILKYMKSDFQNLNEIFPQISQNEGYLNLQDFFDALYELQLTENVEFSPSLVRGFDYYDGIVFEVFDQNKDNPRAMFGGGRYNGLANIFGVENFPSIGFAPGNETLAIFLENWNLVPEKSHLLNLPQIYLFGINQESETKINKKIQNEVFRTASKIRNLPIRIFLDSALNTKSISSGLDYASKKGYEYCLMIGSEELSKRSITLKKLDTGQQIQMTLDNLTDYFLKTLPHENT